MVDNTNLQVKPISRILLVIYNRTVAPVAVVRDEASDL